MHITDLDWLAETIFTEAKVAAIWASTSSGSSSADSSELLFVVGSTKFGRTGSVTSTAAVGTIGTIGTIGAVTGVTKVGKTGSVSSIIPAEEIWTSFCLTSESFRFLARVNLEVAVVFGEMELPTEFATISAEIGVIDPWNEGSEVDPCSIGLFGAVSEPSKFSLFIKF